jgi:hypothetical protein
MGEKISKEKGEIKYDLRSIKYEGEFGFLILGFGYWICAMQKYKKAVLNFVPS